MKSLMNLGQILLEELIAEAEVTRRHLSYVPFENRDFQPAEKSETLGRLAIHVAEIMGWWESCLLHDHLDFIDFAPKEIHNTHELLEYFDHNFEEAKKCLTAANDEEFDKSWSMCYGKEILFTLPKYQVLRIFCMNHLIHHRAQLGVYLRILGIPVPAGYGPSADDENVSIVSALIKSDFFPDQG